MAAEDIKRHKFCGKVHDIDIDSFFGYCESPFPKRPTLYIDWYHLSDEHAMEISIHEALHACNWNKSEEVVAQTAKDIARFLWRLGYR